MKTLLFPLILFSLAGSAHSAIIASWDFETNTPADLNDSGTGPIVLAEVGTGSLQGVHAAAATDWSTPAGYQSTNSYSSNTWTVGDYIQLSASTTNMVDITVSFGQISSGTGPGEFRLDYGTDGSTFTTFANYTVLANAGTNQWSFGTTISNTAYTFDLSAISAIENQATVFFRLVQVSTLDASPPGTVATGGTSRIDNVVVTGVPEPATALLGAFGLLGLLRRRR